MKLYSVQPLLRLIIAGHTACYFMASLLGQIWCNLTFQNSSTLFKFKN